MFCAKCGMKNDDTSLFCAGCGNKLVNNTAQEFDFFKEEPVVDIQNAMDSMPVYEENEVDNTSAMVNTENTEKTYENNQIDENAYKIDVKKNKFSVKRFIFSMLAILLAIASCVTIFFESFSFESTETFSGEKSVEKFKVYEIVKDGINDDEDIDEDYIEDEVKDEYNDVKKCADLVRVVAMALVGCLVVFGIVELILLIFVRKRGSYILTFIFTLINLGISGLMTYLFCFDFLDKTKELMVAMIGEWADIFDNGIFIKITANVGMGMYLLLGFQAAILICSIILMTCKNNKKN